MTTIDNNNYELWLLRYAEGDLTAEERAAVETWLASHPDAAEELALYNEAPRLERDETVKYRATPLHRPKPLWPAVLRFGAAAAVVLLLMLPAMRMGLMDKMETPLLVAENRPAADSQQPAMQQQPALQPTPNPQPSIPSAPSIPSIPSIASIDSIAPIPSIPSSNPLPPIETDMLIAFEDDPAEAAPIETWNLIVYDRSADWGDMLLAANDAYHEALNEHPIGRLVSRTLPDRNQLEEAVVAPLRQRIDNKKNNRK